MTRKIARYEKWLFIAAVIFLTCVALRFALNMPQLEVPERAVVKVEPWHTGDADIQAVIAKKSPDLSLAQRDPFVPVESLRRVARRESKINIAEGLKEQFKKAHEGEGERTGKDEKSGHEVQEPPVPPVEFMGTFAAEGPDKRIGVVLKERDKGTMHRRYEGDELLGITIVKVNPSAVILKDSEGRFFEYRDKPRTTNEY